MATVNYVSAASSIGYIDGFATIPDSTDYNTLTWIGTAIPKATLDAAYLETKRQAKIAQVSAAFGTEVISVFLSDALVSGVFRKYDSDVQGQIAIVGAVTYCKPSTGWISPTTFVLSSVNPATGARDYHSHDLDQLHQLFDDLGSFASSKIDRLTTMIGQIYMINTGNISADLDAIESITW